MSIAQNDEFNTRIKRINSGKTSAWTVPGEGLATQSQEVRMTGKKAIKSTRKPKAKGLHMLPVAMLTGAVAVVAGRWITYTYLSGEGPIEVNLMELFGPFMGDVAVAAALSLLLTLILGLTSKLRATVHLAAFAAVLFYEHELVHLAPDQFAMLYPASWVNEMLAVPSVLPL